ncbi:MAG: hypothetical protein GDA68_08660 [Nitrospira sp. CR2.1]|nr:hypothetical protein [Nitrospira sp. CR2.1]MBA5876078.1 hypothetical protein [Nitrospira sp. CR1.2]
MYALVAVLILFTVNTSDVFAEIPVNKCDEYAADPGDRDKVASGVVNIGMDLARAMAACSEAITNSPEVPRFHFQLGRSYWLSKMHKEGVDEFRQAAEMGYPAASAYLGKAYQGGIGGLRQDYQKALKHYEIAFAGGFAPLANSIEQLRKHLGSSTPETYRQHPAKSVWKDGIPESLPRLDSILLTEEVLTLLMLKYFPQQVAPFTWDSLIQWQVENDKAYYKRISDKYRHGLQWGMNWDSSTSDGYHPKYVPFSPPEFFEDSQDPQDAQGLGQTDVLELTQVIKSNPEGLDLFHQWTLRRSSKLPPNVILLGKFNEGSGLSRSEGSKIVFDAYVSNNRRRGFGVPPQAGPKQDYDPSRTLTRVVAGKQLAILLPQEINTYVGGLDKSVLNDKVQNIVVQLHGQIEKIEGTPTTATPMTSIVHLNPTGVRVVNWQTQEVIFEKEFK